MKLYVGDYLGDTQRLTTTQHGAYLLLIMAYWQDGGPLPDDNETLGAITKLPDKEWRAMRPKLANYFDIAEGFWIHPRIEEEIAKAGRVSKQHSAAGKASAEQRRRQRKGNGCPTDVATAVPTADPTADQPCQMSDVITSTSVDVTPLSPPLPKRSKRKPGTPLPGNWVPRRQDWEAAGLDAIGGEFCAAKMRNWAEGSDARKVNWDATFRNFCLEESRSGRVPRGGAPPSQPLALMDPQRLGELAEIARQNRIREGLE